MLKKARGSLKPGVPITRGIGVRGQLGGGSSVLAGWGEEPGSPDDTLFVGWGGEPGWGPDFGPMASKPL